MLLVFGRDCYPGWSLLFSPPVPPLSDYLGTHQCSENAKLGVFPQSLEVREFGKKGVLL